MPVKNTKAPSLSEIESKRPQIEEIGRRFGVSHVRLFGSVAEGKARPGSDLDLLVKMESGRSLLDIIGFQQAIEDLLNVPIDVIDEGGIHPLLETAILSEARTL